MFHSKELTKLTEAIPKEVQTLDLMDPMYFKVLNILKDLKKNMDKELKEIMETMQNKMRIFKKR